MRSLAVITAVALVASVPVLAPAAQSDSHEPGALRQLSGAKGCWVPKASAGCSVYRLPARDNPAGVPLDVVSTVIVSPDGRNVYAAANPYTNLIAGFTRSKAGALAPIAGRAGCVAVGTRRCDPPIYRQRELSALAISPDGRNLYSAADYRYVQAVQAFGRVAGGGLRNAERHHISCTGSRAHLSATDRRNHCGLSTALGEPRDLVVAPDGRELYVAADNRVDMLRRNRTGGTYVAGCVGSPGELLRKKPCDDARAMSRASGVAIAPGGRHVYVATSQGIAAFARDASDGTLTQLAGPAGCVTEAVIPDCATGRSLARSYEPARSGGNQVAISSDGKNVYLAARYGIAAFARNARTGALTQLPGSTGCIAQAPQAGCTPGRALHSIEGLVVSPDGASVYAAAYDSGALAILARTASGALQQPDGTAGCVNATGRDGCALGRAIGAATGVAIAPDGRAVYLSSYGAGLAVFARP